MGFFIAFIYSVVILIIKQFQLKKKTIIKVKTAFVPKSERLSSKNCLKCSILTFISYSRELRKMSFFIPKHKQYFSNFFLQPKDIIINYLPKNAEIALESLSQHFIF